MERESRKFISRVLLRVKLWKFYFIDTIGQTVCFGQFIFLGTCYTYTLFIVCSDKTEGEHTRRKLMQSIGQTWAKFKWLYCQNSIITETRVVPKFRWQKCEGDWWMGIFCIDSSTNNNKLNSRLTDSRTMHNTVNEGLQTRVSKNLARATLFMEIWIFQLVERAQQSGKAVTHLKRSQRGTHTSRRGWSVRTH